MTSIFFNPKNKFNWAFTTESTNFDIQPTNNNPIIPKKNLNNKLIGTTISIVPYRKYFEPCILDDGFCRIDIKYKKSLPVSLGNQLLSIATDCFVNSKSMMSFLFDIKADQKHIDELMACIENFFLPKESAVNQLELNKLFNQLRHFVNTPNREYKFTQDNEKDISDEEMAHSVFGRGCMVK